MIVIGLTGGIGMGKSTVARLCQILGAKTISADALVHRLMQPSGRAFAAVAEAFPAALQQGEIDRKLLGAEVFSDEHKRKTLEAILHPLVIKEEEKFVAAQKRLGARVVVLDIPLLFEVEGERRMDVTLLATAPAFIQRRRVLARPNMTEEKLARILAVQMPDREKRKRADVIIHTGLGKAVSMRELKLFLSELQ